MKNLIITLIVCLPAMLFGQAVGEIQGKVFDENNDPIPFLDVYVKAGEKLVGTMTNEDGRYKIKPLKPGVYNVTFSGVQYQKYVLKEVHVNPDNITFLPDVTMKTGVHMTDEAIVEAYIRPLIEKENTGVIRMHSAEFENSPAAKTPIKLIASMTSEVSEGEDGQLYFRGARPGSIQYIVDGVKLQSGMNNRFPSSAIGSISVYTGGVPAKYGDLTGGVIVIETKNYFDFYNAAKNANQ